MSKDKKLLAYQTDEIAQGKLRASQKAVLKAAEKSVEKGDYDDGVNLYSKLLSQSSIQQVVKVKIEKNINNVMGKIKKTVQVAKQFIPQQTDIDQVQTPQETSSEGSFNFPPVSYPQQEIEIEYEPVEYKPPSQNIPQVSPDVNINDANIEGVSLKNVNLENISAIGQKEAVTEELLSDAIDYTIDKVTDNISKMLFAEGVSVGRANFRNEKLFQTKDERDFVNSVNDSDINLNDHFFDMMHQLTEEIESLNDNIEDLKPAFISKISDSIFPQTPPVKPKSKSRAQKSSSELSNDEIDRTLFQQENGNSDLPQGAGDYNPSVEDHEVQIDDNFFHSVDKLKDDMEHIKDDVENLKSAAITDISDRMFPKYPIDPSILDAKPDETTQDNIPMGNDFFDKINSLADKLKETNFDRIDDALAQFEGTPSGADKDFTELFESIGSKLDTLGDLNQRSNSLEKEMESFSKLVDLLNDEKEKRKESEKSLEDFEKSLKDIKDQLSKNVEEEKPEDFFTVGEEVVKKKVKKSVPKEDLDKRQYYPDSEVLEAPQEEDKFHSLEEVLDEDLSHAQSYTKEDAMRDEAKSQYHKDVDPAFIPEPYSTDFDYKQSDGFFQDITGKPILVKAPQTPDNIMTKPQEDLNNKLPQTQPETQAPPPITIQLQEPPPPPPKPRRTLRQPIRLTYDFRNIFNNKYYRKYRDMLNEAATLVAEKKLDEALEYYHVISDQNIPQSFKLMIQQNIKDIEETISDTFRYSDTIVKVDDAGEISRVRIVEEEELEGENFEYDEDSGKAIISQEVAFRDE